MVEILSSIAFGLLVWYEWMSLLRHSTTPGELIAFIMLINMLFHIRMLADRFNTLQMGMVSAERVFKVIDTHSPEENPGIHKQPMLLKVKLSSKMSGSVMKTGRWGNWVLKGISFSVKRGETIALVGATGAGKHPS